MPVTVAILEDDLTMRSLLETLLSLEGYNILILNPDNQTSVVNQITNATPEVLFLDVHLKYFSGIDVVTEIRTLKPYSPPPLVIMASGMDLKKECLSAGANLFLLKPYMPRILIDWLAKQL